MNAGVADPAYEGVFRENERHLWALCYRMTACAADADDLVQETFVRAIERPPADTARPWRPWLVRVAMNLSRDALRRRRRQPYVGPWLPGVIETGEEASPPSHEPVFDGGASTENRYDLLESVSIAFLFALEALTPAQRAVLLLRDVFDYSVREVSEALGMGEANVKTTHHRARNAMAAYERGRRLPTAETQAQLRATVTEMTVALAEGDARRMEALLAEQVSSRSDGAGEFLAARKPLHGRRAVVKFFTGLRNRRSEPVDIRMTMLNGWPALVLTVPASRPREPERFVICFTPEVDGRIARIDVLIAPRKLTAVEFVQSVGGAPRGPV